MTERDREAAFPLATIDGYSQDGMSLRDYFAGQALAGLCARTGEGDGDFLHSAGTDPAARWAYRFADAMLAAREDTP